MNEFQREQIHQERAADRQHVQNTWMLADLVRSQQRGGAAGAEDGVSRAAKRAFCTQPSQILVFKLKSSV